MKLAKKRRKLKVSEKFVVYDVPLSDIYYDIDFNCRRVFGPQNVADLAKSIEDNELQFPIIVQPFEGTSGKPYRIVAGHRRFKAFQLLKRDTIPAMIRENLTDRQAQIINFTENLEREDLNMIEEALVLRKLFPHVGGDDGVTMRGAAKELKKSARWVEARIRVLLMPAEVQQMFASGRLAKHFLDKLWKVKSDEERIEVAKAIIKASRVQKHSGKVQVMHDKLPEHLRRKYTRTSRSKHQIMKMVVRVLDASVIGLAPRMGAWCAGYISTEDFLEDIRKRQIRWRSASVEESEP